MPSIEEVQRQMALGAVAFEDQIEREVANLTGGGPIAWIVAIAKAEAADALQSIATLDPIVGNLDTLRALQNDVRRYNDLVRWLRTAVSNGREAWHSLSIEDKEEVASMLLDGDQPLQEG